MQTKIKIALILLVIASIGFWAYTLTQPQGHQALPLSGKPTGGDFTLQSTKGNVSLSDFKGKVVFLYFGYTFCPDICPTNLGNIAAFMQRLSAEERRQFQMIFVSVDTARDTPKHMEDYSTYFDKDILGLSGDKATVDEIVKRYGAVYAIVPGSTPDSYSVDHSAFTYVIGKNGQLIDQLPHASSPDVLYTTFKQVQTGELK